MSRGPRPRVAARVVLLDDLDHVLLFRGIDPGDLDAGSWWFTPGGGVDPDESLEQAARRELAEETGIHDLDLGPCVWTRLAQFTFEGIEFEQREWFFLARTTQRTVDTSGFVDYEQRSLTEHRWWSLAELRRSDEVVWPRDLASLLATLLTAGPPGVVIEID
jgi:8-oxo-dGTP pyrophosphatase MutT (NUDIX family)